MGLRPDCGHGIVVRQPADEQRASPKSLQQWLLDVPDRDAAIVQAHRLSHISMSAIAKELGLSVSWVSRTIAKYEAAGHCSAKGETSAAL